MKKTFELVTDAEISKAWGNANFGSRSRRQVIKESLQKHAMGYTYGKTAADIVLELGLIEQGSLSNKGLTYLLAAAIEEAIEEHELAWRYLSEEKPKDRQRVFIQSTNTGEHLIIIWSPVFNDIPGCTFDKWYPLPS